jgi:CubicO group peptidase (beta-lactamase class C family)
MVQAMQALPLAFHPGTQWEYSMATDVLARVVEVVAAESFGHFLQRRIFGPLGMQDTGFRVPEAQQHRLCAMYVGSDTSRPDLPGLQRADDAPYRGAYLRPVARESGGGGLVSTLGDMVRLVQSLRPGGPRLLKPDTVRQMGTDQLPPGLCVRFANSPPRPTRGFGLGCAVLRQALPDDPRAAAGEVYWGGLAGTAWWFNPRADIAGVLMTQRYFGSGGPHELAFRQHAYAALTA